MATIPAHLLEQLSAQSPSVFAHLQEKNNTWPLIAHLKNADECIENLAPYAAYFQNFRDLVILGTGGSSLGAQALTALCNPFTAAPHLHFVDNIDSLTFHHLLTHLNPNTTAVLSVSKSGNTAETLIQTLTLIQTWQDFNPAKQMMIITENKANAMREVAATYSVPCLDHPDDVGGRFSVFTIVGLLPAMIAGVDVHAFCAAALDTFNEAISATPQTCAPLSGAMIQLGYQSMGMTNTVLFSYTNHLSKLCDWFAQLWAESLGKKGAADARFGTTPIKAIGAVDQHSQLQLYIDGPRDKFFTFLTLKNQAALPAITVPSTITHAAVCALNNRSMGDLMIAEQRATIDTMRRHDCPLREMQFDALDPATLGALMMHFMLETLAAAAFLQINPFDQPAVEEGKILALQYLNQAA